jgi:hypothetical protein
MELARLFDGRKYMWDGKTYNDQSESQSQEQHYRELGFEVQSLAADGKHYLFTRRVVTANPG